MLIYLIVDTVGEESKDEDENCSITDTMDSHNVKGE